MTILITETNVYCVSFSGYIRDVTGNYSLSFYTAGIFIVISGCLLFVLPAVEKYKQYALLLRTKADLKKNTEEMGNGKPLANKNGQLNGPESV